MSRYIDEKDVYKLVEPNGVARVHCSQIDELPRADVVEVVRCKDCIARPQKYLEPFACARNNILVYGNSFCSYGKRRSENEG